MKRRNALKVMKEPNYRTLRNHFALVIFAMILFSTLITTALAFIAVSVGIYPKITKSPIILIISLFVLSTCIASVLAYYVNIHIMKPIINMSKASKEVAKGNFNIRLNDDSNIEEIRITAKNFNNMVTELNSIETLRDDFIANVSHEFKTPLSAIEGYTMLLQEEDLPAELKREYIKKITDSTHRLSSLAGNILLISKLDNRSFNEKVSEFRLDEQLREAILSHELTWDKKKLELDIELEEVKYRGEEPLLLQVWLNLIGNACKFTPEGGRICVKLTTYTDRAEVTVSDNGPGIDASAQKHIFEKFYQADTSHKSEGNGLGLALVKKIVEKCNGSIEVKSEPGKGSEFKVTLAL